MKTLQEYAQIANARLNTIFPVMEENSYEEGGMPELLARSMNYSLLAGGKRLRPSMLLAAVDMLGGDIESALDFACAVEMIHSYSLIHDGLYLGPQRPMNDLTDCDSVVIQSVLFWCQRIDIHWNYCAQKGGFTYLDTEIVFKVRW